MNHKIMLSSLVVMACLVACAAPGEDNNYKMLDDDPADAHGGPYGSMEGSREGSTDPKQMAEELAMALADEHGAEPDTQANTQAGRSEAADESSQTVEAVQMTRTKGAEANGAKRGAARQPSASAPPVVEPESAPAAAASIHATTAPSLNGLHRSHWPKITVGPVKGTTHHWPIYFRDLPIVHREPAVSAANGLESLDGARPANYDTTNAAALVAQPLKVGIDIILLIPRAVLDHPLKDATTP